MHRAHTSEVGPSLPRMLGTWRSHPKSSRWEDRRHSLSGSLLWKEALRLALWMPATDFHPPRALSRPGSPSNHLAWFHLHMARSGSFLKTGSIPDLEVIFTDLFVFGSRKLRLFFSLDSMSVFPGLGQIFSMWRHSTKPNSPSTHESPQHLAQPRLHPLSICVIWTGCPQDLFIPSFP